jgi:hypothetical protein
VLTGGARSQLGSYGVSLLFFVIGSSAQLQDENEWQVSILIHREETYNRLTHHPITDHRSSLERKGSRRNRVTNENQPAVFSC